MEESVKISLIIISHNQPGFIRRLLEGITDSSLAGLEVIVSDDCSTDSTVAVTRECLDKLQQRGAVTKVLASFVWGGAGGARNKGAMVCP